MEFLDRFSPRDRDRLLSLSTPLRLRRGEVLIRRGERGGDLFRILEGELEVLDGRTQPAVVLDVMGRGSLVGEMAFVDPQAVRSADVRAADATVCQRWERGVLQAALDQDPSFSAAFYRALSGLLAERTRATNVLGGARRRAREQAEGSEEARRAVSSLYEALHPALLELEPLLRRDRDAATKPLLAALHSFQGALHTTLGLMSAADARAAGAALTERLHPWLMRTWLGELALERASVHGPEQPLLAHLDSGAPTGDGPLGQVLDEWLLSLPTSRAIRERRAQAASLFQDALPPVPPMRALLAPVGSGNLLHQLLPDLGQMGGELIVMDGSRDVLSTIDRGLATRPPKLRLRWVQEDLAALAFGQRALALPPQNAIVCDGALDALPDRLALALLQWAWQSLRPDGSLILTALDHSPDEEVYRFLLEWPLIRRPPAALQRLLSAAGFQEIRVYTSGVGISTIARKTAFA